MLTTLDWVRLVDEVWKQGVVEALALVMSEVLEADGGAQDSSVGFVMWKLRRKDSRARCMYDLTKDIQSLCHGQGDRWIKAVGENVSGPGCKMSDEINDDKTRVGANANERGAGITSLSRAVAVHGGAYLRYMVSTTGPAAPDRRREQKPDPSGVLDRACRRRQSPMSAAIAVAERIVDGAPCSTSSTRSHDLAPATL